MDDLRSRNGTEGNEDDGGHTVVSVVPYRDEDAAFPKVAGDEEEEEEEDRESRLRGSFRLHEEGDGGTGGMSQKNSRKCAECLCFKPGHEPEDDTESRAALPREKKACSGLGLIYTLLASVFFSVAALLVKKLDGIHAVEISAIRCFFQMLFVIPAMIYHKSSIYCLQYRGYRREMIYNRTIRCHPDDDGFPFESGSSQGFFVMSSQGVFPGHGRLWLSH